MNTPSNAGKEHNPDGLTPEQYGAPRFRLLNVGEFIKSDDEYWDPSMRVWHPVLRLRGLENKTLRRATPPTQSQEGEMEVDTAHKQFHAQDEYAHHPGVSLEFARNLHSRLTAAQRENDRLRSEVALIEWQNQEKLTVTWNHLHGAFIVQGVNQVCGNMGRGPTVIEALRAATEEGKRG